MMVSNLCLGFARHFYIDCSYYLKTKHFASIRIREIFGSKAKIYLHNSLRSCPPRITFITFYFIVTFLWIVPRNFSNIPCSIRFLQHVWIIIFGILQEYWMVRCLWWRSTIGRRRPKIYIDKITVSLFVWLKSLFA